MAAAAGALRECGGRLRGATSFVVDAGSWRGPASQAFQADAGGFQTGLTRAADTLDQAAAALAELAARLAHAQSTWDRAQRLAAIAGVTLDPHEAAAEARGSGLDRHGTGPGRHGTGAGPVPQGTGLGRHGAGLDPGGGVGSPADAADPLASVVGGQAVGLARAAEQEAAAARRVAAARLEEAARTLGRGVGHAGTAGGAGSVGNVGHASGGRASAGAMGAGGGSRLGGRGQGGSGHGGPGQGEEGHAEEPDAEERPGEGPGGERHEGPVQWLVGRVLELGAEVATATHHLVSAAEARIQAAERLAATADDPAVRAAARRVVETAGRPAIDGAVLWALPLAGPMLEFSAGLHQGEPLPRALVGALGSAVGADLGGRAGLAACGGEAAVTEGAGLIICPTLTAVGGALGAQAGRAAALHVYDEITGPPPDPAASSPDGGEPSVPTGNPATPSPSRDGTAGPATGPARSSGPGNGASPSQMVRPKSSQMVRPGSRSGAGPGPEPGPASGSGSGG